ncbi:MAG: TIGR02996 domain-containing protein [Myxococcota bacterium]
MLRNPALEAAVVADPDRVDAFLVYGDWLLEQGDPRGQLSTLDRALADDPWGDRGAALRAERSALFEAHRDELLGPLAEHVDERRLRVTWAHGFLREARVGWRPASVHAGEDPFDVLTTLLAHPSARLLHTLTLGPAEALPALVDALVAAPPPALRRLTIGVGAGRAPYFADVGALSALSDAVPNLRELVIRGTTASLGALALPALERLDLGATVDLVDLAHFPALRALSLWGPGDDRVAWLAGARNPLALGLHDDEAANETVRELLASPLRPTALDLSMSGLTQGGALLSAAPRLRDVPVDVSLNRLTADTCRRLQGALPQIALGGQASRREAAALLERVTDHTLAAQLREAGQRVTARDAQGAAEAARLALRQAVWIGDTRAESRARATLAWAEQDLGNTEVALDHARQQLELERDFAVTTASTAGIDASLLALAQIHRSRGDVRHAETLLDATASVDALVERAYSVLVQGRAADALALADRALERAGPEAPWNVHNIRGAVLQTLKRYEEADDAYAQAEARAPGPTARARRSRSTAPAWPSSSGSPPRPCAGRAR